ncbi:hypothetical protein ACQ4PT_028063 [Festuca glaucescens]
MDAEHANNGIFLPYDLHLDILRRLPGPALAASRCVCRAWLGIIDAHALLLPHIFPREFPGIFAAYQGYDPRFGLFGPPASRDADEPAYRRLYWDSWEYCVKQHCNGLLLFTGDRPSVNPYVCNPATSRYARLPCPPTPWWSGVEGMFLAFDPAVSRHHELFFFPKKQQHEEERHQSSRTKRPEEKVVQAFVFSSQTDQWESREFTPRHNGSGHLYDVMTAPRDKDEKTWWSAEYWHGSLYVHCHSGVLVILRCSERTYDMIQLPRQPSERETVYQLKLPTSYLASYERGIRYVMINDLQLEVWELTELAGDRLEWTLAHKANLKERDHKMNYVREEPSVHPRKQWAVVVNRKDLISLFDDYSDEERNDGCNDGTENDEEGEEFDDYSDKESNDDCRDESENGGNGGGEEEEEKEQEEEEEEEDNHDKAREEEEQKYYNDDEIQGEVEAELYNDDETQSEVEAEPYNDDETQGEDEEEQDSYGDNEDEELSSNDGSDYSWNSDQHNFIDFDNVILGEEDVWGWGCTIVGFHPYKDVLLLKFSDIVVAYHLHTSRMQYLGYVYPYNHHQQAREIHLAFPYRPCYVDDLLSRDALKSS